MVLPALPAVAAPTDSNSQFGNAYIFFAIDAFYFLGSAQLKAHMLSDMKTLTQIVAFAALVVFPAVSESRGVPRSLSARTTSASRPHYGGYKHTVSHGGKYPGETNDHHKHGKYRSPVTGQDQYGTHKP